ncbi:MAG: aminotransferase class III-fold pyridoxal phosphate-dependent enzyme [Betaproteobacteria bacterium]|jgi:glutamate-1-semialdehyde 2,1-aminomutase|nr:aminotransferase class III-fold pyridoxal phosphate-dependent enzyme [Betaproteobacteria bacterium]HAB47079.1 glutamate-1-semialdehyde 2,1-aminomutase [Lautropia sp.]NBO94772.1 aminotransferase class III-fold pyridoxal phosphate-dependent enzyme [Betaproteobacteria bacterium]NBP35580.1 aminotransferase class III-fold pyridoxal phosphate-dependent enzyme [Betaproteobacteria bacterium]NBP37829.1 aminotransferase class III-fold pyridoxal phosphate-dependent enzyme [Betaproteobacteria bacterium]
MSLSVATITTLSLLPPALLWAAPAAYRRLLLSRAKHRSLAGHSRMAQRVARLLPGYRFDEQSFFRADECDSAIELARRSAFYNMSGRFAKRYAKSIEATERAKQSLADLQFISNYRVPFQFSDLVKRHLKIGSVVANSHDVFIEDLDGNLFYDLSGSYGVNLLGYDFYKRNIVAANDAAQALGPVLGMYHPAVIEVAERLRVISMQDEVSFHMSGTEAVMQAVRLARYNTGKTHLVRFCGAYHGWWEDVQPGPGNPMPPRETYTLEDMSERSLKALRMRNDVACVLVNPLQALHPNRAAPGDSSLVDSSRKAGFDRTAYTDWLKKLRALCTARGIVLIFDEVFLGFRLAPGGAQEYFGVQADMVTYGKTLGGGYPCGVLCGKSRFMRRYREDRPADICFARGTFNAHPYVINGMLHFLRALESAPVAALYEGLDARFEKAAADLNQRLRQAKLPVQVASMASVWTILFEKPSRYNWMLQFYLREAGLALSWVGSGRLIFSLNYHDEHLDTVFERFVGACLAMQNDAWWHTPPELSNKSIRRRILKELFASKSAA